MPQSLTLSYPLLPSLLPFPTSLTLSPASHHAPLAFHKQIDLTEHLGWTALMEAAFGNQPSVVQLLLAAHADPRLENRQFESAITNAREVGSAACVALLSAALSPEERLLEAAKSGDAERLEATLLAGFDAGTLDHLLRSQVHHSEHCTLLHWAGAHGHVSCIQRLLAHGAVVDARAPGGGPTALLSAKRNWHLDAVRALLDARADPLLASSGGLIIGGLPVSCNPCAGIIEEAAAEARAAASEADDDVGKQQADMPARAHTSTERGAPKLRTLIDSVVRLSIRKVPVLRRGATLRQANVAARAERTDVRDGCASDASSVTMSDVDQSASSSMAPKPSA